MPFPVGSRRASIVKNQSVSYARINRIQYTDTMKLLILAVALSAVSTALYAQVYVISDLDTTPSATTGWVWESFADRVMGGKSELVPPAVISTDSGKAMLLAGKVITKGGGFIQVRLKHGELFNASPYAGVEIEVDAKDAGSYYVFLRTKDNIFPWSYYGAKFVPTSERTIIRIPWDAFKAESTLRKSVRTQFLSSVALVAAFEDFNAYLRIYRVGLYR